MKRPRLERKSTLKRSVVKRGSKLPSKRKKTQVALWAEYGLQKPSKPRYSGLGGILWYVTSQYIRKLEFKQYGGTCVDGCGVPIQNWQDADCGHFRSATSLSTRFLRENLALQRKYCNSPNGGNGQQYAFGLEIDRRYGKGTADRLTNMAKGVSVPFSQKWYHEEILRIQALLEKE